jgi:DNA-binding transcriptional regulator YiaG
MRTIKRRPGRQKGEWRLVTPEKIREFRTSNKLSRATMSKVLGVSSTTIQNWETNLVVATNKAQSRLAELMAKPSLLHSFNRQPQSAHYATNLVAEAELQATGAIVSAYLSAHPKEVGNIAEMVRNVRQALRS